MLRRNFRRFLASERGGINVVTTVSTLLIAGVVYLGYAYLPHWFRNRDIVAAMREVGYQAWRVRDNEQIRKMVREKTDRLLTINDGTGEYPVIGDDMIQVSRDDRNVYISLSYQVPMHFPWTQKMRRITFDNSIRQDTKVPTE